MCNRLPKLICRFLYRRNLPILLLPTFTALSILWPFSLSAQLADTPARELFKNPADTLLKLTFANSLSIYMSNWLARLVYFLKLGERCLYIPMCWFLRQHIFWHAHWDSTISSKIFQWRCLSKLWNKQWSTRLAAWQARRIIQSNVWMLIKLFISLIITPHNRWFFSIKHRLR